MLNLNLKTWHFSIWQHPHHYAAGLVAKLATNVATMLWAAIVLSKVNALDPTRFSFYQFMIDYGNEDMYAGAALVFSIGGIYRILAKSKPHWWGGVGYAVQAAFWIYIAITYVFLSPLPLRPATGAWLVVGAILSAYAFVANPRTLNGTPTTSK